MSAILLCCGIFLGTQISKAYVIANGADIISTLENETLSLSDNGFYVYSPSRKIVVEEVDKHGNSVVKELELPDYDDRELLQNDRKKNEEEEKNHRSEKSPDKTGQDLYGCDNRKENQLRKCLQRQKKFLKNRYRNWKALIRRIIKDLDGKIRDMSHDSKRRYTTENINFMSGFSPKNAMRKKE